MSSSFQNNPFNFLDLQLAFLLAKSLGKQRDAGVDRIDVRRGGLCEPAQLDHGAGQGVDLDVLLHRSLMFTHLFAPAMTICQAASGFFQGIRLFTEDSQEFISLEKEARWK
jgi:hypothetical protein